MVTLLFAAALAACGGQEAVQPTSTPTLDIGRDAVQPTSTLTAGEAPTLDIRATPPTTASGPSETPEVKPPGSGIRGEIIYQGEKQGALAIVVWKGQPEQGEPTRFLPLDAPGAFSISPLDPDRYSVGAILSVGRNMPGILGPNDLMVMCATILVAEDQEVVLEIAITDDARPGDPPRDCVKAGTSPVVKAWLSSTRLPSAQMAAPSSSGCQEFEDGVCAELRWKLLTGLQSGEVTRIRIAPSDPNVVYAAFDANDMTVWKSTDAGVTWQRVSHTSHPSDLIVHLTNPDIALYSVLENNVYGTSNGGRFWQPVLTAATGFERGDTQFNALAQAASQPNIIYAATGGEERGMGLTGGNSVIFRSDDTGSTWERVWEGEDMGAFFSLAVATDDPKVVLAGSNTGIFRSIDSGLTWTAELFTGDLGRGKIYSIANTPSDPALFFAAHTEGGVFRSDDGGLTWVESSQGITDGKIHQVVIAPSDTSVVYAGTHSGIFRSDDGGRTWQPRSDGLGFLNVATLDVHPSNPDIVYAGTGVQQNTSHSDHFIPGFQSGDGLYKTTNGGLSWTRTDDGIEEYEIVTLMGDPNIPYRMWLGGAAARGAFMSPDGGDSFLFIGPIASHYSMIIASGRRPPYPMYMTSWHPSGELMKSEDMGSTWSRLTPQLARAVSAESREVGLYRGESTIWGHLHGLAIDPSDDDTVYVGSVHDAAHPFGFSLTGAHIFKSTDAGATFIESDQGFPIATETAIGFIVVDPADSNVVYVATNRHESTIAIGVYKSSDAGATWAAANTGLSDLDVRHLVLDPVNPGTLYAATGGGVYKSTDGGTSWQKANSGITTTEVVTLAMSPTNTHVLYAATARGVFKTKDGGSSWYAVNLGLPAGGPLPIMGHHVVLAFDATGSVLFAVVQAGDNPFESQRFVYRVVLGPLTDVGYTYSFTVEDELREIPFESTSAIYDVSFDSNDGSLSFTAAGPAGTEGRTSLLIPRSLLVGPFQVTLDESPIVFELDAGDGESGGISFSHAHSISKVAITGRIPNLSATDVSTVTQECNREPLIPSGGYQGLLTDVHVHTVPQFDQVEFAKTLLEEMNANGVDRVVVQPNHDISGNVVGVQSVDEIWGEIGAVCSRLIPMVYGFDPDQPDSWEYVRDKLAAGGYGGVGEIDIQHGSFDLSHDPESESFLKIYDLLEAEGLAVHFQAKLNQDPSVAAKLQRVIGSRPNLNFVWFGHSFEEQFMALPNLYGETTLHSQTFLGSQNQLAISLIASDASPAGFDNPAYPFLPYESFGEAMVQARQRLSELPEAVADALAHGNFDNVWPKDQ